VADADVYAIRATVHDHTRRTPHHHGEDAQNPFKPETLLVNAGRDPKAQHGFVNPPVYHASTVLYPTAEDQFAHRSRYQYGRRGTPTSEALETALTELEGDGCAGVALLPSGLAAISTALIAVAGAGDHILVTDSVYRPTAISATAGSGHGRGDNLLRSADRRRYRQIDEAEHQGGVRRSTWLAKFRHAGHSGHR